MKTIAVLIWLKVIVMILAVLVVLYLLMLMPRLTNRRERKKFLNVYYAHRGLHDNETDAPVRKPVSYTHLDVYKRQVVILSISVPSGRISIIRFAVVCTNW